MFLCKKTGMEMAATGSGLRKMVALQAKKSQFIHPYGSYPGFSVIFSKSLEQSRLEKDRIKAGECTMML